MYLSQEHPFSAQFSLELGFFYHYCCNRQYQSIDGDHKLKNHKKKTDINVGFFYEKFNLLL